jgi:hypothetical protein
MVGTVMGYGGHGNEPQSSTKSVGFLDQLLDYYLAKKDYALRKE